MKRRYFLEENLSVGLMQVTTTIADVLISFRTEERESADRSRRGQGWRPLKFQQCVIEYLAS